MIPPIAGLVLPFFAVPMVRYRRGEGTWSSTGVYAQPAAAQLAFTGSVTWTGSPAVAAGTRTRAPPPGAYAEKTIRLSTETELRTASTSAAGTKLEADVVKYSDEYYRVMDVKPIQSGAYYIATCVRTLEGEPS